MFRRTVIFAAIMFVYGSVSLASVALAVPTITCPPDRFLSCGFPTDPAFNGSATGTSGSCGGPVTITHTDASTPANCTGRMGVDRTWRVADTCGNFVTCVQHITFVDNTAPQFGGGCGASGTYQCISQIPGTSFGGVGPIDNCDPSVTLTVVRTSNGGAGCVGNPLIITDTYTATDDCGNFAQCVRTHTVIDNTAPVITCPAGITVQCVADIPVCNPASATATDNCGSVSVTCSDGPYVGDGCNGTVTRTFVATDACGNSASCSQTITVHDNIAPVVTCPADRQLQCGESTDPSNTGSATAAPDNCGGAVTIAFTDAATPANCTGLPGVDRTWTAADGCGNQSTCVQHITFVDATAPTIACPADAQIECGASTDPSNTGTATASADNCGGPVTVTHTDVATPANCTGLAGIDRTWRAEDGCGNFATCVQHIAFIDATAPIVSCPADKELQCGESTDTSNTGTATATDNCSGAAVTFTDAATPASCTGLPGVDRTWTATDGCGNSSSCVQHITFVDLIAPVVTTSPDISVTNDSAQCGAIVNFASSATDNCGGSLPVTCDQPSGSFFPTGTTTVTCTATDACGNTGSHVLYVTVTACPCHHDPICDSITNILDVVEIVNVAFRNVPESVEPCPVSREDVNCDGQVDVVDVVRMVNVAFRNANPATEFCQPCL